ncbi:MAG: hypothetical protein Q4E71_04220, partial [Prevotella sp.]|nr:hypothetical protein [Prevotella sp.]
METIHASGVTDGDFIQYIYITMAQSDLDNSLKKQLEQIRDETREHANTATRIGGAFLALFSYLGYFLRKDGNDVVNGIITFVKGILIGKG